jgi:hypothetical protein
MKKFTVEFCAEDIKEFRPEWSTERCEEFLERNWRYISETLYEMVPESVWACIQMDEADEGEE